MIRLMDTGDVHQGSGDRSSPVRLSEHERRLLQMLASEMSLAEMAQQLGLAETSLRQELEQLHRKIRVLGSR
jgi:DNA-binding CsgD family transcriptional regulator